MERMLHEFLQADRERELARDARVAEARRVGRPTDGSAHHPGTTWSRLRDWMPVLSRGRAVA